jgi:hypothetical protein
MVRAFNPNAIAYSPGQVPEDNNELRRFLAYELNKIQTSIAALALGHIDKTHVAPVKPREGDIRFADGTNWNPGSGKGIYFYDGTVWKLLG